MHFTPFLHHHFIIFNVAVSFLIVLRSWVIHKNVLHMFQLFYISNCRALNGAMMQHDTRQFVLKASACFAMSICNFFYCKAFTL